MMQRRECLPCHADHLLWAPARYLALLHDGTQALNGGHYLGISLAHADARVQAEANFLLPAECDDFPLQLLCNEVGAYRPTRDPEDATGTPYPSPADWDTSVAVREWRAKFVDADGYVTSAWRTRALDIATKRFTLHRWPHAAAGSARDFDMDAARDAVAPPDGRELPYRVVQTSVRAPRLGGLGARLRVERQHLRWAGRNASRERGSLRQDRRFRRRAPPQPFF